MLAIAALVANVALSLNIAHGQGAGGSFSTYYGADTSYRSHFGASRPAGRSANAGPSYYEPGMDADSLYAAAAPAPHQRPAVSPAAVPPAFFLLVPENNQAAFSNSHGPGGIRTVAALTPGANWNVDYANFQGESEEVPPLPAAERVDAGATAPDGEPRFGQQQQDAVLEIAESPLAFLRSQSVLLDKGERQIDVSMTYAMADGLVFQPTVVGDVNDDPVVVISPVQARQRLVIAPIEFRYGLTDNMQVYCSIPFGWANAELAIPGLLDEWSNRAGIGDVTCGATVLLREGCGNSPDILGGFSFTAPTGQADFFVTGGTPNSRLGEGFWAVSTQLTFIQTFDPCVLFYGLGYRHRFDDNFLLNVRANPGEQFIYQMGLGFAANESVTFATSFVGVYTTEDHINGVRVQGGITEPMRLRFSATIAKPCKIVEPFAEVGMNRDSADSRIGITWTY